ncbi:ATP-dependent DNA helicase [Schaalia sp. ZJ1691]|uniref:ATP-dependent helicase n=1 Tax=Schaalia sp. ZJ1691 TaxID=2709404 RepID=UPI0013EB615C|nr:ATP-dependent DNA helicase [Schaalia sp. ZJ1691]
MISAAQIQKIVDPRVVPTPEQVKIIEAPLEPLLVVAGAGSGKTETMSMRVLWVVANHHDITPSSVLGLTFTRKAAGELGDRLRGRLRVLADEFGTDVGDEDEPVSLTYNSFAQRIVAEHGLAIGVDPDFRLLSQAESVQIMTDIMENWPEPLSESLSIGSAVDAALSLAGQMADHGLNLDETRLMLDELSQELSQAGTGNAAARGAQETNAVRLALLDPIRVFHERKRDMGVLDFSDQLTLAHRIVSESASVCEQLRREHRVVLLDEFQDTSVIQMELLSTVFRDHPVTAVGDPNQAIYGWRGASASSLEKFLSCFRSDGADTGAHVLPLSKAWRNDRKILVAANAVASPLRSEGSVADSPVLVARSSASPGTVDIAYPVTMDEQLDRIVDFVHAQRRPVGGKYPSVAVLCRRRQDFAPIDRALRDKGIPTQVVGLGGLLQQPVVSDLRAALILANDPTDSPWLARLLANLDLGVADYAALGAWSRELAQSQGRDRHDSILIDAVDEPPHPDWTSRHSQLRLSAEGRERIRLLGSRLRSVRHGVGRSLVDQVERAMSIMGIRDDAIADPLSTGGSAALDAFVDVAVQFHATMPQATLSAFLTWLDMAEQEERGLDFPIEEPDPHAVQIMTIHASKGLEWDAVVVAMLSESTFPNYRTKVVSWNEDLSSRPGWVTGLPGELPHPIRRDYDDLPDFFPVYSGEKKPSTEFKNWLDDDYGLRLAQHHEREERRLAYVALTRAKHAELLVGSWVGTGARVCGPSRYLMNARNSLASTIDTALDAGDGELAVSPLAQVVDHATVALTHARAANAKGENIEEHSIEGAAEEAEALLTDTLRAVLVVAPTTRDRLMEDRCTLNEAIASEPDPETVADLRVREASENFPVNPGPSRQRIVETAERVGAEIREMRTDADVFTLLRDMGDDPAVRDVTALLEEERLRQERRVLVIEQDALPATSVSSLLEDPEAFAREIRRPIPTKPSEYSELGTILHAWIERQLHREAGEPSEEPIESEDSLDDDQRRRLDILKDHFRELAFTQRDCVGIEEPFSVNIGGISVRGRIDAVFREKDGRFRVVDWKSGRPIGEHSSASVLRYYVTQLRLYRKAWADRMGIEESTVEAEVVFLSSKSCFSLSDVEKRAGISPAEDLSQLVTAAFEGRNTHESP